MEEVFIKVKIADSKPDSIEVRLYVYSVSSSKKIQQVKALKVLLIKSKLL